MYFLVLTTVEVPVWDEEKMKRVHIKEALSKPKSAIAKIQDVAPQTFCAECKIGGEWNEIFLVKEDCYECSTDCAQTDGYTIPAPSGYKRTVMARKKDIQWEAMKKAAIDYYTQDYNTITDYFKKRKCPENPGCLIIGDFVFRHGELVYRKGETLDEYLALHGIGEGIRYPCLFHGYIKGDTYIDKFAFVEEPGKNSPKEAMSWQKKIEEFIDSLSEDMVLVGVECHI